MMELLPPDFNVNHRVFDSLLFVKFRQILAQFFFPAADWTWFVTEGEAERNDFTFFGYVIGFASEWGYFSLRELEEINVQHLTVERDLDFRQEKMSVCLARWKEERGEAIERF